jgi:hypothetical protein
MKTKIEIKSVFGNVLFEYEKENNTIKETLIKAIENGADLRGANLYGADLRGANLYGADLRGADLRGADLRGANLYGVDLYGVDLYGANLYGADLYGADLRGADLYGAGKLSYPGDILCVGNIGSRLDYTTIYNTDKGIFVKCGCFFGTIAEFEAQVEKIHKGTRHERDYKALVEFAKVKFAKFE